MGDVGANVGEDVGANVGEDVGEDAHDDIGEEEDDDCDWNHAPMRSTVMATLATTQATVDMFFVFVKKKKDMTDFETWLLMLGSSGLLWYTTRWIQPDVLGDVKNETGPSDWTPEETSLARYRIFLH